MTTITTHASATPSFDYLRGLDGLRALAVLLVLVAHLGLNEAIPGGFGVTVFFFISGLLITRLLLAEHAQRGTIAIGNFYLRRLIRLYPAMLAAILLATLVFWLAGGILSWGKVGAALLYCINYYDIYSQLVQTRIGFDPFSTLWSLAVEQQFYLLFPCLCVIMLKGHGNWRRLCWMLAAMLILGLLWRLILVHAGASSRRIYMGSDTRIDSIFYGAWLALILACDTQQKWRRLCNNRLVQLACLTLLLLCFVLRQPGFRDTLRYSLQGLALMPLMTALCFSASLAPLTRMLEWPALRRLGRWSYSLYLTHPIAIVIAEMIWGPGSALPRSLGVFGFLCFALTAVLLSFALTTASYYGIEQPMQQWRRRFGAHVVAN